MKQVCAVRFTRYYRAAPAEVWAALTEPDSLARWLGPMGDSICQSTRSLEPEKLLEVDWTPRGESPSVVRFELRPDGTGTVLVLDHRRIDARVGMRAMGIWERHLERLNALLGDSGAR